MIILFNVSAAKLLQYHFLLILPVYIPVEKFTSQLLRLYWICQDYRKPSRKFILSLKVSFGKLDF